MVALVTSGGVVRGGPVGVVRGGPVGVVRGGPVGVDGGGVGRVGLVTGVEGAFPAAAETLEPEV